MTLFGKILTGGLLLLLVGGGVSYMARDGAPVEEMETQQVVIVESTSTQETTGKKMAFSQFISTDKGSYKCEVNQYVSNIETKGTVFVKNGMIKGEFTTAVAGRNITANMIARDGYSYSWSSMAPTVGYKTKLDTSVNATTTASTSGSYSWNADQIGDYNCVPEEIEDSQFSVPASINFTTVN